MGKHEEMIKLKRIIQDNERENKKLLALYDILDKSKELWASELMKAFLNKECATKKPRDVESITFPETYCATKEEIVLFARAVTLILKQENEPEIIINRV